MRDAVIVSTARTPIGKAFRGAFNITPAPTLAAHAIRAAVERAGIDPQEIEDTVFGAALQQGGQAMIGRHAPLRAGLPITVSGMSIDGAIRTVSTATRTALTMASRMMPPSRKIAAHASMGPLRSHLRAEKILLPPSDPILALILHRISIATA